MTQPIMPLLSALFTLYACGFILALGFLVNISNPTHNKFIDVLLVSLLWPIVLLKYIFM